MAMKMTSSTDPESVSYRVWDLLLNNPPFGSAGFLVDALADEAEVLQELQVDMPEVEPVPEPALSGLAWIEAEFDRLRALPFAASDAGSDTRPKKSARDNSFVCSMYGPAEPLKAAEVIGRQWPYEKPHHGHRGTTRLAGEGQRSTRARACSCCLPHRARCARQGRLAPAHPPRACLPRVARARRQGGVRPGHQPHGGRALRLQARRLHHRRARSPRR